MKNKDILKKAKRLGKTIVFPEAGFSDRTIEAVKYIQKKGIAKPILIGDESALVLRDKKLIDFQIINPQTFPQKEELVKRLYKKRKDKGLTIEQAQELVLDPYYFATLLVDMELADGMVAGAEASTANTVRPALQVIKAKKKGGIVSSCFIMYGEDNKFLGDKCLILSDCGVIKHPTEDELYQIACHSVETYKSLGFTDPKVAFLSFSTKGSAEDESINVVRGAYEKFKKTEIPCDGEMQFDSAMVERVGKHKNPNGQIQGDANILIFPDLNSGNICYKAMQYVGGLTAVGPILQGLNKPINDLSRGCTVEDIIIATAITALQSNKEDK
ncbi:MAG: phosphate acetyltransferase [Clostridiales bacterium]|nr:phosphate acetyltransferase [Clostridiales bacterium]